MRLQELKRNLGKIFSTLGVFALLIIISAGMPSKAVAGSMSSLTTTSAGGNAQDGNMFNVTALKPVIIKRFSGHFGTGAVTARIYYRPGGYVTTTDPLWVLAGTASITGVNGEFVEIPIDVNLTINAGETYGFYITNAGGTEANINYTNGDIEGYSNSDLSLASSIGIVYPFGATYSPRIWNGIILYDESVILPRSLLNFFLVHMLDIIKEEIR